MMTPREFFRIARQIKWKRNRRGAIRAQSIRSETGSLLCPLAYVSRVATGNEAWAPRDDSRLPTWEFQDRVIDAADGLRGKSWLKKRLGIA